MLYDKFYTKPAVAGDCFKTLMRLVSVGSEDVFLEPSAGSGVFVELIKSSGFQCTAYDIAPEGAGIEQRNVLKMTTFERSDYITLGNPPFGGKGALAAQFINKLLPVSKCVAFILPLTFIRYSAQSKIIRTAKLIYNEALPEDSFTCNGEEFKLRAVFQIWTTHKMPLTDIRLRCNPPTTHPDFALYRHNATAGTRKYLDFDWQLAVYAQGHKEYSRIFTRDDYAFIKDRIFNSSDQFYFFTAKTPQALARLKQLDWEALSRKNAIRALGFSKWEIVEEYKGMFYY
ncbi:hypothetical protein RsTz2092_00640 [Deferribacterales bacterium RsTz2092]|nr:hypothetical protein AGMMS49941_01070 [Deferribacterales bacterium]